MVPLPEPRNHWWNSIADLDIVTLHKAEVTPNALWATWENVTTPVAHDPRSALVACKRHCCVERWWHKTIIKCKWNSPVGRWRIPTSDHSGHTLLGRQNTPPFATSGWGLFSQGAPNHGSLLDKWGLGWPGIHVPTLDPWVRGGEGTPRGVLEATRSTTELPELIMGRLTLARKDKYCPPKRRH
jgi:hypothetical protein